MGSAELDLLYQNRSDELFTAEEFPLDDNVRASFPNSVKITAQNYGTSAWTRTARLNVENSDGTQESYFLKCAPDDAGRVLLEGEFNSIMELNNCMPSFTPKPHSWGKYKTSNPDTYFFISQYINMSERVPEPKQLCQKLAQLHRQSVSPDGKFGFHVTTCQGHIPQSVAWEDTWTECFTKMFLHVKRLDFQTNGYWADLDKLQTRIVSHIIPRLIGILEQGGRKVKPCLLHGDLWEGNTGTSFETGDIYIFDAAAIYAHNEFEIGNWRCHYNKIHNPIYTKTYLKHFGPSEPREEWEDRNRMYCIYWNTIYSVNHASHGTAVRQRAYDDMFYLIDKFAPFPKDEEPPRINDSERALLSAARDHTMN